MPILFQNGNNQLEVGAALAAIFFGFAAKAAPTNNAVSAWKHNERKRRQQGHQGTKKL
jgi:hypothetical protein